MADIVCLLFLLPFAFTNTYFLLGGMGIGTIQIPSLRAIRWAMVVLEMRLVAVELFQPSKFMLTSTTITPFFLM